MEISYKALIAAGYVLDKATDILSEIVDHELDDKPDIQKKLLAIRDKLYTLQKFIDTMIVLNEKEKEINNG